MRCGPSACWLSLLLVLGLVAAVPAADKKPRSKAKQMAPTVEDAEDPPGGTALVGKLVHIKSDKTITLRVEFEFLRPHASKATGEAAARHVAKEQRALLKEEERILREQDKILRMRDPLKRQQELQRFLAREQFRQALTGAQLGHGRALYVAKAHKDFVLQATTDTEVRIVDAPDGAKKSKSKKGRKGQKDDLPGRPTVWSKLQTGQVVRVYLRPPKPAAPEASKAKPKDDDDTPPEKMRVTAIVIVQPAMDPTVVQGRKAR